MAPRCDAHDNFESTLKKIETNIDRLYAMAWPKWARGALLFVLVCIGGWVFAAPTLFATKGELEKMEASIGKRMDRRDKDHKEDMDEVKSLLKEVIRKIK